MAALAVVWLCSTCSWPNGLACTVEYAAVPALRRIIIHQIGVPWARHSHGDRDRHRHPKGLSPLMHVLMMHSPVSHLSPKIKVCAPVCAEAVRTCDLCSGFKSAKALVRWLPSPVRGLPFALGELACWPERRDPGWDGVLDGKNTIGRVGCCLQSSLICWPGRPPPKCLCQRAMATVPREHVSAKAT
jgi:hypothetical protein